MIKGLISIIVPVYNAEKYLNRCIESILNQTYCNIQLVLINDGSIDGSLGIIENYAAHDSRIIAINKDNTGVSDTRNTGIEVATGEYIGFVDADDYVEPNMYEIMHCEITSSDADICCCGYKQEYTDYRYDISISEKCVINGSKAIIAQYLRQDIRNGIFNGNWNKLFRRTCIDSIRYKNIKHGEDVLFQYNSFKKCNRMVCIPNLLYHYVNNDKSATNSIFNRNKLSIISISREITDDVISNYPELIKQAYAFNLTWHIALLQDYYINKGSSELKAVVKDIRKELVNNKRYYINNEYSKRLDQYYLRANMIGLMKPAMFFRNTVRCIKPSKDKKAYI